jgi:hypothetical protein
MKIKCAKAFEWLSPYINEGMALVPEGKKLSKVMAWKLNGRAGKGCQACIYTNDHKTYRIYIHTMYHPRYAKEPMPYSKIDILGLLAHEMAHMLDMYHSPEHKILETQLLKMFMRKLKKEGYVNEEEELAS